MTKKLKTIGAGIKSRAGRGLKTAAKISLETLIKLLREAKPDEIVLNPQEKTITVRYTKEF